MRKAEYLEGPAARENFEKGMEALFRIPKAFPSKKKSKEQVTTLRKKKTSDKD